MDGINGSFEELGALMQLLPGDDKHKVSSLSVMHTLWALFQRVLRVDPEAWSSRDIFILSKGHGPMAYYASLAQKGLISTDDLRHYARFDSILGHHPDRVLVPGVEMSSGSLGHGLPFALGWAMATRLEGEEARRVVVLIGDGELDEGSNFEALACIARFGLQNVTAIVIDNGSAALGWPGGIDQRFMCEGWRAAIVEDGDTDALVEAMVPRSASAPLALIVKYDSGQDFAVVSHTEGTQNGE